MTNKASNELRETFDASFAIEQTLDSESFEDMIVGRTEETGIAIRLSSIEGFFKNKAITKLPSNTPAFLGLVGINGTALSVWSLSSLLGGKENGSNQTWMASVIGKRRWALTFAYFDGFFRVPSSSISLGDGHETCLVGEHQREILNIIGLEIQIQQLL